ncbi:putative flavin-binding monooxygenase [Daldinia vernicosa]|uniref:putative flavin-binding monooxygenase n=1 Tax=Daldinia vernicosa TaxID=114800 RepID=UPI0020075280|nr:putative flavin-binding monooxygenase [Daldinia vernicosa]KAI0848456.1 putative flavin-binding monooxygenase [Daldinia vernicosa]
MATASGDSNQTFDVIIVGAGISGINCAYRLQTECPGTKFIVLESRDQIGGTWDQFRFPGVRSDSDLYSYGFAWHDWPFEQFYGDGPQILEYMHDAISAHKLEKYIKRRHLVLSSSWQSSNSRWELTVDHGGRLIRFIARFIVLGTGHIDHNSLPSVEIPGIDNFGGRVISPQFWPRDYDYEGERVAVIGSGATAVTMLPHLAKKAMQISLIQRSPTYVVVAAGSGWLQKFLPLKWVARSRRFLNTISLHIAALFCAFFPNMSKKMLLKETAKRLPEWIDPSFDFEPRYNPGEQRLCLDPDGKFYSALHLENVRVMTGNIKNVVKGGILMQDGQSVDVDVIVMATGFRMRLGGGIQIKVNGNSMSWSKRLVWNGAMLDGVPNMIFMLGYPNNAWTLRADDTAFILVRLLSHMDRQGAKVAVPLAPESEGLQTQVVWKSSATYVLAAQDELPVCGMTGPWKPRVSPPIDRLRARWGDITSGLHLDG